MFHQHRLILFYKVRHFVRRLCIGVSLALVLAGGVAYWSVPQVSADTTVAFGLVILEAEPGIPLERFSHPLVVSDLVVILPEEILAAQQHPGPILETVFLDNTTLEERTPIKTESVSRSIFLLALARNFQLPLPPWVILADDLAHSISAQASTHCRGSPA